MHRLANPGRFMRVADAVMPWLVAAFIPVTLAGLYYSLVDSPADYQQRESVRIMYIHVPAALLAQGIYIAMALGSASFLIWKHPLGDLSARAIAPIGMVFCLICLVTGSLWGKPTWGTYWVWDARLTSMLILLFLFMGYMALATAFEYPARGDKPAAILAVVGIVNIPIIKFSVYFFNTLHQKSTIFRDTFFQATDTLKEDNLPGFIVQAVAEQGSALPFDMARPLFLMLVSFTLLFLILMIIRLRGELLAVRLRAVRAGLEMR